ncbi:MAG: hypothetical protein SWK76_14905 [Actinomycetota bacterium]|nr:hypothetical protein [Actinomycetota bacterium]
MINHMLINHPQESNYLLDKYLERCIDVHPESRERVDRISRMT